MSLSRRHFLGGAAVLGAAGLATRPARARIGVRPVAILVLDFVGGWNVHATFAAREHPDVNPYGMLAGNTGVMRLSKRVVQDRDGVVARESPSWGERVPGIEDVAGRFSVIGSMRHDPAFTVDDHVQTARYGGTGYLSRLDAPGLGTVISRFAPAGEGPGEAPHAVLVNPGGVSFEMTRAPGDWLPHMPFSVATEGLPVAGGGVLQGWRLQKALDDGARAHTQALARARVDRLRMNAEALRRYRPFFLDPAVHTGLGGEPAARYERGILGAKSPTTAQLREALGGAGAREEAALAMAFRCLEGGSRFVAAGLGAHDTHEAEASADATYVRDGQLLAGVSFLLEKCGLADRVLVVALSEMARSTYVGFLNAGGGTDHGPVGLVSPRGLHGSNRQTVLLAHGPVAAKREVYPADPVWGDPVGAPCVTAELLAFLAECAGVEREDHPWSEGPDGAAISADALARGLVA